MNEVMFRRLEKKFVPEPNSGCWLWLRSCTRDGYGRHFAGNRGGTLAHRAMYEAINGPIQAGLEIDHKCRVRCCVNPDHLEPVTHKINCLRGLGLPSRNAKKSRCKNGHSFDASNTKVRPTGHRICRACAAASQARYRAKRAA